MYSMEKDTYFCDLCGEEEKALEGDGYVVWECEDCGKHFCSKCFASRLGWKAYGEMVTDGKIGTFDTERIFCPECYAEILKDYAEKEG